MKNLNCIFFLFTLYSPVFAYNEEANFENGSIIFSENPGVHIERKNLFVGEKEISAEYFLKNTNKKDISTTIDFQMSPNHYQEGLEYSDIENFKVWVNGSEKQTKKRTVVLLDDRSDITKKMDSLGWSIDGIEEYLQNGNVPKKSRPLPKSFFNEHNIPRFTLNEYYFWSQNFPAGEDVVIKYSYRPSIETDGAYTSDEIFSSFGRNFCIDQGARSKIQKIGKRQNNLVEWKKIHYILKTPNNWQGPIKDFTLTIKKSRPSQILSLCFDGDFKKKDSMTFEFHQKDFKPTSDLNLLLIDQLE
jgi:hypothetical protein